MKLGVIIFFAGCTALPMMAQSIYDEEDPAPSKPIEKPAEKPAPTGKTKKKLRQRYKKKRVTKESNAYTPEDLARLSYIWSPHIDALQLASTPAGLKANKAPALVSQQISPIPAERPQGGGKFRLPEIPLAQVLIVAGFVILFLIYRLRVGSQLKRKKY